MLKPQIKPNEKHPVIPIIDKKQIKMHMLTPKQERIAPNQDKESSESIRASLEMYRVDAAGQRIT